MKNPFEIKDTAYHMEYGEVVVVGVNTQLDQCDIVFEDHLCHLIEKKVMTKTLSFKPWPAPCHERPIKDGWWIVFNKRGTAQPLVRKVSGDGVYDGYGQSTGELVHYTFHTYLGENWK